jgi:LacI family transcriptional regulator
MVLVNRRVDGLDLPSVTADDEAGIALAVAHLAGLGHTRIAHLAGPRGTSTGLSRARAFRHAILDHGLTDDPALTVECGYWSEAEGAKALRELLDSGAEFTAIVAGNDLIALGCYDVFAERGLRCPVDISVVGFNEMPFLDKMRPPLTTVAIPHYDIGVEAARLLLDTIEEPERHPRSVLLAPSLVVRASTAVPSPTPGPSPAL